MMGRRARCGAGILMAALLVLFLAPRELFHACGHAGTHGMSDGPGVSAPAHCAACDMVVPPFEQVPLPLAPDHISSGIAWDVPFVAPIVPGHVCIASARGPPATA